MFFFSLSRRRSDKSATNFKRRQEEYWSARCVEIWEMLKKNAKKKMKKQKKQEHKIKRATRKIARKIKIAREICRLKRVEILQK